MSHEPLGPRHPAVRGLRALLRDRSARDAAQRFVLEGPRQLDAAIDRGIDGLECFVGPEGEKRCGAVLARARSAGVPVRALGEGVTDRIGDTVTSQGLLTSAPLRRRGIEAIGALRAPALVAVCVEISDPGNAGTLIRSAEAAGAHAVVLGAGSVDAYNPKVVRASAGAVLGVPVAEGVNAVEILETLGARGVQRLGAVAASGERPEVFDLTGPTAFVLGHEVRGLEAGLPLDAAVTIPMAGPTESLNLAMAATVLLFEAARRRRALQPGEVAT